MGLDLRAFAWDAETGIGIAVDRRDGGLVIHDPKAHKGRYARHLDRNQDISLSSIGAYLNPAIGKQQIAEAIRRYRNWVDDAPRLYLERLEAERAELERLDQVRRDAEERAADELEKRKRVHVEALRRLTPHLKTLGVSDDNINATVSKVIRMDLAVSIEKLAAGKPVPLDVHDQLRAQALGAVSAVGYEIALEGNPGEVTKALGAAASWRAAGRPLYALRVLDPLIRSELPDSDRSMTLTVIAAALVDLGELDLAKRCAKHAQRIASRPEYAENVLARIASLEERFEEAFIRFENASLSSRKGDFGIRAFQRRKMVWTERYDQFIASPRWAEIRNRRRESASRCEECEADSNLEVHHRTYDRFGGGELHDDLAVLCRNCHEAAHNWQEEYVAMFADTLAKVANGRSD